MINDALRLIRKFNEYTAKDLSEELNISPSYLSEIETGKKTPSLEIIKKYSDFFNIKMSTIMFFAEEIDNNEVKENTRILVLKWMKALEKFGELNNEKI